MKNVDGSHFCGLAEKQAEGRLTLENYFTIETSPRFIKVTENATTVFGNKKKKIKIIVTEIFSFLNSLGTLILNSKTG